MSRTAALVLFGFVALCGPAFAQASPDTKNWLTQEKAGQWRSSKIKGLNIYNDRNDKIGDINDLIVDRDGKIDAVVIGVGGFLGVGEHDVAVPFNQVKWVDQPPSGDHSASNNAGTAPNANTGNANTTASSRDRSASTDNSRSYPDHGVLNMNKDQLKAAPEFKYSR